MSNDLVARLQKFQSGLRRVEQIDDSNLVGEAIAALTAAQPEAEHVRVPVEPTDEFIEGVARRLCIHAYPDRSLDEVLAPNVKLWMRMKSEAMQAIDAVIATAKEAK